MVPGFLAKYKRTLLYGASMAFLLFLLKWLELRFVIIDHAFEVYAGAVAIVFTALGVWLALKLTKPKVETRFVERLVEKKVYVRDNGSFTLNQEELDRLGISGREHAVLRLMAEGLSNEEIAARLFVSRNTVKTHSSNLFSKMNVRRRTQAVERGKKLGLIP
ncbi:MAG TPA: LuxR C-terminal-related transcriptional regulator [Anseongella sp.]|nr:LuxR C-terminal-related transcriptional regulator [Anseongella sp.]